MKVGIVAGEKSGDYLGSELIKAIKLKYPDAEFIGLCGPLMQEQGAITLAEMDKISIMGLAGVIRGLLDILSIRRRLYKHFIASPPDVFIGIDVPDFNLGLEKKLKQKGIPTVHYVSPTVWAWRSGRIKKIRESVDLMLTLFPFEELFYQQHNTPVKYVGHPLAKQVLNWRTDKDLKKSLLQKDCRLIAMLPGSRMNEVSRLAPAMIDAAIQLKKIDSNLQFVIPVASPKIRKYLVEECHLNQSLIKLVDGKSRDVLSISDLVVLASGTAALEAALFSKPMVVMYKMDWLTVFLFKHTVKVKHFSMPNHLIDPPIVPELLQDQATSENVVLQVQRLLEDRQYFETMQQALSKVAQSLSMDTGKIASEEIFNLISNKAK